MLESFEEPATKVVKPKIIPETSKQTYDLTTILAKNKQIASKPNINKLQEEIKEIKADLKRLQSKQEQDSLLLQSLLDNDLKSSSSEGEENKNKTEEEINEVNMIGKIKDENFIFLLQEITSRKYLIPIKIKFSENFIFVYCVI